MKQEEDPRIFNPFQINRYSQKEQVMFQNVDARFREQFNHRMVNQAPDEEYDRMLDQVYEQNLPPELFEEPPPVQWQFWKRSNYYQKDGDVFTKQNIDFMRCVYAQQPLPSQGVFVFQLRVIVPGTIGFGIVTSHLIQQFANEQLEFVDSRWPESLFLCTFSNGSSIINVNGHMSSYRGPLCHVPVGKYVNMIINMSQRLVIFVKEGACVSINFRQQFGNKDVVPFFQIKNIGAAVQVKQL